MHGSAHCSIHELQGQQPPAKCEDFCPTCASPLLVGFELTISQEKVHIITNSLVLFSQKQLLSRFILPKLATDTVKPSKHLTSLCTDTSKVCSGFFKQGAKRNLEYWSYKDLGFLFIPGMVGTCGQGLDLLHFPSVSKNGRQCQVGHSRQVQPL